MNNLRVELQLDGGLLSLANYFSIFIRRVKAYTRFAAGLVRSHEPKESDTN
jgi:hypothetical protein